MDWPPALRIAVAVSSAGAGSRSLTTISAPSVANSFAAAAPMPRPEPVRMATLPSSIPMIDIPPLDTKNSMRYPGRYPAATHLLLDAAFGQFRDEIARDLHIALLVGGLHFSGDIGFAVGLVFLRNLAGADDGVVDARHTFEAYAKF